jgi:hypothetical protein
MDISVHGPNACHTGPAGTQTLACHDELALKDINEFGALMLVEREPCTWLKSKDLHLQSTSDRDVFNK